MPKNTGRGSVNGAGVRAHQGTWRTGIVWPSITYRDEGNVVRHSCGWGCPCGADAAAQALLRPTQTRRTRRHMGTRLIMRLGIAWGRLTTAARTYTATRNTWPEEN